MDKSLSMLLLMRAVIKFYVYRNYEQGDPLRKKKAYFVHCKFLPGLGFYGFGLIHMIGGLSKTATLALRQLLDAGTSAIYLRVLRQEAYT